MIRLLYKFRPVDKYAFDLLVNKRLFLASWEHLNDAHEARLYVHADNNNKIHANPKRLKDLGKILGIDVSQVAARVCALSKLWNRNLLWSHYADGHRGIAVGISIPESCNGVQKIEVQYDDLVPEFSGSMISENDVLKALTHKSKEWEYEEEVRFVTFDESHHFLNGIEIREVIFGLRTPKDDIHLVREILKDGRVSFLQVIEKSGTYHLNRRKLA